jgi:hypothetical protein
LKSVSYENTSDDDEKVIYIFPQTFLIKSKDADLSKTTLDIHPDGEKQKKEESSLGQQLIKRGVTEIVATELVKKYSTQQIERQVEVFDWLLEVRSPLLEKNPPGFLRKSIEENYQPPKEYLDQQNRKDKEQRKEDRQERWLKHREELISQDVTNWDQIPLEKRIEGRLGFWITGETMNGRTPMPEQMEIKKKELIDGLPRTDDEKWEYIAQNYPEEPPDDFR